MNGHITQALNAVRGHEPQAQERLLALISGEIHEMAHRHLAREKPGHGLQTTVIVDDVFVRLLGGGVGATLPNGQMVKWPQSEGGGEAVSFENRRHFFGAAAEAIRRILIDHARSMSAEKRGGRMDRVGIDLEALPATDTHSGDWEALGEALTRLEAKDPRAAEVVRLRFFAGLSEVQAAEVLGVTDRTVRRDWVFAKAWLAAEMKT